MQLNQWTRQFIRCSFRDLFPLFIWGRKSNPLSFPAYNFTISCLNPRSDRAFLGSFQTGKGRIPPLPPIPLRNLQNIKAMIMKLRWFLVHPKSF